MIIVTTIIETLKDIATEIKTNISIHTLKVIGFLAFLGTPYYFFIYCLLTILNTNASILFELFALIFGTAIIEIIWVFFWVTVYDNYGYQKNRAALKSGKPT